MTLNREIDTLKRLAHVHKELNAKTLDRTLTDLRFCCVCGPLEPHQNNNAINLGDIQDKYIFSIVTIISIINIIIVIYLLSDITPLPHTKC